MLVVMVVVVVVVANVVVVVQFELIILSVGWEFNQHKIIISAQNSPTCEGGGGGGGGQF